MPLRALPRTSRSSPAAPDERLSCGSPCASLPFRRSEIGTFAATTTIGLSPGCCAKTRALAHLRSLCGLSDGSDAAPRLARTQTKIQSSELRFARSEDPMQPQPIADPALTSPTGLSSIAPIPASPVRRQRNEVEPGDPTDFAASPPMAVTVAALALLHVLCCSLPILFSGVSLLSFLPIPSLFSPALTVLGLVGLVWYLRKRRTSCRGSRKIAAHEFNRSRFYEGSAISPSIISITAHSGSASTVEVRDGRSEKPLDLH